MKDFDKQTFRDLALFVAKNDDTTQGELKWVRPFVPDVTPDKDGAFTVAAEPTIGDVLRLIGIAKRLMRPEQTQRDGMQEAFGTRGVHDARQMMEDAARCG